MYRLDTCRNVFNGRPAAATAAPIAKAPSSRKLAKVGHEGVQFQPAHTCLDIGTQRHAKLLIANRGEISRRVIRSAKSLGIPTVVVFTEPDALSLHVTDGDEAFCLGASPKEYTNADKLLEVMKSTK